ncbi:hypothetical protein ACFRJ1_05040 [Streptomyces sp. NPDC056773]|uniref:hypothetical protein n=1 Tax=unclassified Streptomyces TaxID=2593676 RepID=UPI003674C680
MAERDLGEVRDVVETQSADEGASAVDKLPALLLLVPAMVLLRFLGEHGWAYWTAAVLGCLGVPVAVFAVVASVRSLVQGRRRLASGYSIALLLGACFVFVNRLIER